MHLSEREVLIGNFKHAAYKPCYWTEQSLRTGGRRQCYKHHFGIQSHQCIQSTSFRGCNIACSFCWRDVEGRQHSFESYDPPDLIAQELISEQSSVIAEYLPRALENYENMIKIVSVLRESGHTVDGLHKLTGISHVKVKDALNDLRAAEVLSEDGEESFFIKRELFEGCSSPREFVEKNVASRDDIIRVHLEASNPKHVAISYDGEPTMYSRLGDLVSEFRKRGLSTFVVTNGTFPERIIEMRESKTLPTQLYVTLAAPDKETYLRVCSSVKPFFPAHEAHWERLNRTLGLLSTLHCRTVVRVTSVRGVNMIHPEKYRDIVKRANPSFLEVKGFSISGNAPRISERLGETDLGYKNRDLMKIAFRYAPTHEEVVQFAKDISDDYALFPKLSESELNRQVLMKVGWRGTSTEIDFESEL